MRISRFWGAVIASALLSASAVGTIHWLVNPEETFHVSLGFPQNGIWVSVILSTWLGFMKDNPIVVRSLQLSGDLANITFYRIWICLQPVLQGGENRCLAEYIDLTASFPLGTESDFLSRNWTGDGKIPNPGEYYVEGMASTGYVDGYRATETSPSSPLPGSTLFIDTRDRANVNLATGVAVHLAVLALIWIEVPQGLEAWGRFHRKDEE